MNEKEKRKHSEEVETEEQIKEKMQKAGEERRMIRNERLNKWENLANEEQKYQETVVNGLAEMTDLMKKSMEFDHQLLSLLTKHLSK